MDRWMRRQEPGSERSSGGGAGAAVGQDTEAVVSSTKQYTHLPLDAHVVGQGALQLNPAVAHSRHPAAQRWRGGGMSMWVVAGWLKVRPGRPCNRRLAAVCNPCRHAHLDANRMWSLLGNTSTAREGRGNNQLTLLQKRQAC